MNDLEEFEAAAADVAKRRKVWGRAVVALREARDEVDRAELQLERCRARMSDSLGRSDDAA